MFRTCYDPPRLPVQRHGPGRHRSDRWPDQLSLRWRQGTRPHPAGGQRPPVLAAGAFRGLL